MFYTITLPNLADNAAYQPISA